jgi:hypothetical protein
MAVDTMVENHRREELLNEPKLNHAGTVAQGQTGVLPVRGRISIFEPGYINWKPQGLELFH